MLIDERLIGKNQPPYIVAEISGNHAGVLSNAIKLIKAAKRAGADAVKTQCYEPDSITIDIAKPDFIVQDGLWRGRTLYELYQRAHTPFAWQKELFSVARSEGITIFGSVFDRRAVDLLDRLDVPCFKIASFEITDLPLIEYAAATKKPLIISTGMASNREILEAYAASGNAAFLHCTSDYPAKVETANLGRMAVLDELLNHECPIGLSDHTLSDVVSIAATALGTSIIEKHLRLDTVESEDSAFSMKPLDFQIMVKRVKATFAALQERRSEGTNRQCRRSLYAVKDIKKGELLTEDNIRSIRPGYGLPPKLLPTLLGRKAQRNYRRGDPLS